MPAINVTNLQTFTDAEIVTVLRAALVSAAIAQSYSIGGKTLARIGADSIQKLIGEYEMRTVAAGQNQLLPTALVAFDR
jgi:hypothetical protein